ncbi:hypothetical protein L218DRAFT_621718 [Marasmius fiardii PR-910]|nr:hypothetical protein L218DRAFT_621718 [Marasmius fiardii PR-910]
MDTSLSTQKDFLSPLAFCTRTKPGPAGNSKQLRPTIQHPIFGASIACLLLFLTSSIYCRRSLKTLPFFKRQKMWVFSSWMKALDGSGRSFCCRYRIFRKLKLWGFTVYRDVLLISEL